MIYRLTHEPHNYSIDDALNLTYYQAAFILTDPEEYQKQLKQKEHQWRESNLSEEDKAWREELRSAGWAVS